MDDAILTLTRGTTPLLVSLPHVGTEIPAAMRPEFVERALAVEDTDWHLESLYGFARELGAGVLVPRHSRYVIDLNRPPGNTPMYAGANNTELVPTRFFTGDALRRAPLADERAEIDRRRAAFWQPYHDALDAELARLKAEHGHAILWDGHSIKSRLPWLFEGTLPDLNLGTAGAPSCAPALRAALGRRARAADELQPRRRRPLQGRPHHASTTVGRSTAARDPARDVLVVLHEESRRTSIDPARAARLIPVLRALLEATLDGKPDA
jgi:N-formylglutamate deformylase